MRAAPEGFAEETALVDLRARPKRLKEARYSFLRPIVDGALSDILP